MIIEMIVITTTMMKSYISIDQSLLKLYYVFSIKWGNRAILWTNTYTGTVGWYDNIIQHKYTAWYIINIDVPYFWNLKQYMSPNTFY